MARPDFRSEDLRAAAGERVESSGFEFNQRLLDGFFCEPGEMEDFNRGEAFEVKLLTISDFGFRISDFS